MQRLSGEVRLGSLAVTLPKQLSSREADSTV